MNVKVNKKAVVVLGYPNNGKTTTILHCINKYETPQRNTQRIRLLNQFYQLQANKEVYVQGQSPTESKTSLKNLLKGKKINYLIVAEQIDGTQCQNTFNYLKKEGYDVTQFEISNPANTSSHWNYQLKGLPSRIILNKRTDDIFNSL